MSDHDKMLDRVRKLLAQAEHKNTPPAEAESFLAKAQALIVQYGFEEAQLALDEPDRAKVTDRKIVGLAPFGAEKISLMHAIAVPLGVKVVRLEQWSSGKPRRASRADKKVFTGHMFGRAADLDRVELLYTHLLLHQSSELCNADVPEWVTWHGRTAWNRSFLVAYASRVMTRLYKMERENTERNSTMTKADGTTVSSALVLVDKAAQSELAMGEYYPSLWTTKSRSLSGSGGGAGHAAGDRANLNSNTRLNNGRKALG